jgi:hypothetical protein
MKRSMRIWCGYESKYIFFRLLFAPVVGKRHQSGKIAYFVSHILLYFYSIWSMLIPKSDTEGSDFLSINQVDKDTPIT